MVTARTVAIVTAPTPAVTRVGPGMFRVEHEGRFEIVFVAGPSGDRWVFWNGQVFRGPFGRASANAPRASGPGGPQSLRAPMPATVLEVLVAPGAVVKQGDTVLILEAMKMELPVRAPADGTVVAVHCREQELVQPDTVLVELA
ncbi:MAG: hypothetical protein GEU82_05135 [Luteitalea sp.]|nr:hypothetical protein [Luteitalea sp.]